MTTKDDEEQAEDDDDSAEDGHGDEDEDDSIEVPPITPLTRPTYPGVHRVVVCVDLTSLYDLDTMNVHRYIVHYATLTILFGTSITSLIPPL